MNIGKNIHSENRKKVYRKPAMEVVEVDRDIVLMLESKGNPENPNSSQTQTYEKPSKTLNSRPPSTSSTPFGGSTPDFER